MPKIYLCQKEAKYDQQTENKIIHDKKMNNNDFFSVSAREPNPN